MAKRFKLDVKHGTKKKVTVLRILTEIEKGAKPSEPVAAI
jgi:ribosomal protein S16